MPLCLLLDFGFFLMLDCTFLSVCSFSCFVSRSCSNRLDWIPFNSLSRTHPVIDSIMQCIFCSDCIITLDVGCTLLYQHLCREKLIYPSPANVCSNRTESRAFSIIFTILLQANSQETQATRDPNPNRGLSGCPEYSFY